MVGHLEWLFPGLRGTTFRVTSPPDRSYNCIAWAAGVSDGWWWPLGDPDDTRWPDGVARAVTLDAFRDAFTALGYVPCDGERAEAGFEKVAIFASLRGTPTHAARQLPSGRWTSKLGNAEDIEHDLRALEGDIYGTVVLILKRPLAP